LKHVQTGRIAGVHVVDDTKDDDDADVCAAVREATVEAGQQVSGETARDARCCQPLSNHRHCHDHEVNHVLRKSLKCSQSEHFAQACTAGLVFVMYTV
jgi:hypothetical protein